jgi:hypothetical protein
MRLWYPWKMFSSTQGVSDLLQNKFWEITDGQFLLSSAVYNLLWKLIFTGVKRETMTPPFIILYA